MSGAEAIAALGLLSSIITIIDTTKKIFDAATDARGLPEAFREVSYKLPTVESILRSAGQYIRTGDVEEDDCAGINTIVKACESKAKKLKDLFEQAMPSKDASDITRYYQAVRVYGKGNEVEKLMNGILEDLQLLTCYRSMKPATKAEQAQILQAIREVSAVDPSVPETIFQRIPVMDGRVILKMEGSIEEACLAAMFLTDPGNDRMRILQEKGSRVNGTCEWIKSNSLYSSWSNSVFQPLWLSGGPGKGKTMLSVFIAEEFESIAKRPDSHITFLQYFCDNKDEKRRTATCVVRGLLFQLLQIVPKYIELLLPSFKIQKQNIFQQSSFETLWGIFEQILNDPALGTTYFILDGLDECEETSIQILLEKFTTLFHRTKRGLPAPKFNLLMVSREYPDIIPEMLSDFPRIRLNLDADTEVQNDIDRFIDAKINSLSAQKQYPETLRKHVEEVFRERACGTFLWVGIVTKALSRCKVSEVEKALDQFPSDLYGLYDRMLLQILPERREIAARILRWIVIAYRPLTLQELSAALGISTASSNYLSLEEVMKDQVSYCGDLLVLADDHVNLVHQSTKDYFLRENPHTNVDLEYFRVLKVAADREVAQSCFHYMERALATGPMESSGDIPEPGTWPFLAYAITYWPEHVRSFTDAKSILNLSPAFFKKKSILQERWLESYWPTDDNEKAPKSWTLLQLAAYVGILPLANHAISQGNLISKFKRRKEIRRVDDCGRTALVLALWNGNENMVRLLLDKGASVEDRDPNGLPTLVLACRNQTLVQMLLENGANIEQKSDKGLTALISATFLGNTKTIQFLLEKGAHIEQRDNDGLSVLSYALTNERVDVLRLLVDRGANIEKSGSNEQSALAFAAIRGHVDAVQVLLEKGANMEHESSNGFTALTYAALYGKVDVIQLLVEKGANMEHEISTGFTALMYAAVYGKVDVIQLLVENGANMEHENSNGFTALMYAAFKGKVDAIQLLIEKGANIEHKDFDGLTAVIHAAANGKVDAIQVLVEKGANIDVRSKAGNTALHLAAIRGGEALVRLLLEKGADVDIKSESGATALKYAVCAEKQAVVDLLTSYRPEQATDEG